MQRSGASEQRYYPELFGQGAIFFDADADQDLYLLNGKTIESKPGAHIIGNRFFLNDGKSKLSDHSQSNNPVCRNNVRAYCGLPAFKGAKDKLFHNQGNGKFADVSELLGNYTECCSLGTLFSDLDNNGDQDIVTTCI